MNRKTENISALSSTKIDKYEYHIKNNYYVLIKVKS